MFEEWSRQNRTFEMVVLALASTCKSSLPDEVRESMLLFSSKPWRYLVDNREVTLLGKVSATLTIRVPIIHVTSTIFLVIQC